jgi:hypothetical protein
MFNVMQTEYTAMPAKLKSAKAEVFAVATQVCHMTVAQGGSG